MRAFVQDKYGAADVLYARDVAKPTVGDADVLIRVHAAGVNPADWAIMSGLPYIARPVYGARKPKNPIRGTDVAGTVELVGSGVSRFKPGDEVFGWCIGSFAEYASASEDALAIKPANVTFEQAAAVPLAGLVALQALRKGNVSRGTKVLINGASGGIGTFAVQIAKSLGAHVTGVCNTGSVELVRSLGADVVIDYTKDDFTGANQQYDFILDNVSNHSLSRLRHALNSTGTLVPNGGRFDKRWMASGGRILEGKLRFSFSSQKLGNFLVAPNQKDLVALKELIEAGKLTPVIDHSYPMNETLAAMGHVGEGHARGKTTISMPPQVAPTATPA
jgi:NADPH:quinone reductase-like Zn-dependent oxidoreductase